jgi:hypothetical protein
MISRFIIRLSMMALAVVCLCAGLLSHVEAATVCINPRIDLDWSFNFLLAHDGKNLVWQGGDWGYSGHDIIYYDAETNSSINLTNTEDMDEQYPQIQGNHVVWVGHDYEDYEPKDDIYLHNLTTGLTTNLSNSSEIQDTMPYIDDQKVVWSGFDYSNYDNEVYLYDLNNSMKVNLSNDITLSDSEVQIDGQWITWVKSDGNHSDIQLYDLSTNTSTSLSNDLPTGFHAHPQMNYPWIVWQYDYTDIYLHNLVTNLTLNVSNNNSASVSNSALLYDSYMLWYSSWYDQSYNKIQKIYFYDLETQTKIELNLDAGTALSQFEALKLAWSASDGSHDQVYSYQNGQVQQLTYSTEARNWQVALLENGLAWIEDLRNWFNEPSYSYVRIASCEEGEPPVITDQPDDVTMGSSGNVTLSVTASGKGPLTYQWYERYNGINHPIDGATSTTYTTNDTGLFGVRVTSPFGSVDSEAAIIWPPAPAQPISLFPNCPVQLLSRDMGDEHQTDGEYVVWIDGVWQVNLYDIATGVTLQLSDGSLDAAGELMVDDGYVVWSSRRYNDNVIFDPESGYPPSDIFLYDIKTGIKTNLTNSDTIHESRPQIDGKNIVWSGISSSDTAIYHYDLTTGTTTKHLAIAGPNKDVLQIEGNNVLFYSGDYNSFDIYLYNLETHTLITLSDEVGVAPSYPLPQINQGYVVWHTSYSSRIYLYDIANAVRTQLSANGRNPGIEGHRVAWYEPIGDYGQIHQYDLITKVSSFLSETSGDVDYYNPISLNDRWTMWSVWDSALRLYDGNTLQSIGASNYREREIKAAGNILIWKGYPPEGLFERYGYIFMAKCEGAAPTITDQPDSLTINPNGTATLSVAATGDGSLGYQWYIGNAGDMSNPISGATSSSYTTPALNATTRYWVRVNGMFGSVDSTVAEITMGSAPPATATSAPPTVTPIPATATATDIPATATSIPSTATDVPATETPISPTATSVPATETSIAPPATTVPATQTPLPPTNVPATVTSVPPAVTLVPPTATTVPPTATTVPTVNLLVNGGFEIDSDGDKLPDGWTAKKTDANKADKLKCDKADKIVAHSAPCAFAFSGNPDGSPSALSQQVSDFSALTHGATLTLSAWIDPKSASVGTKFAQVKISYGDGSNTKLKLSLPEGDGYLQQTDSATLDLTGRMVQSVKVDLKYDQSDGKFYVDDVTLTVEAGAALFALP